MANTEHPNILIIFTDDQRRDTIAALGNDYIDTPTMDTLAQSGLVFNNIYCLGGNEPAVCQPSRRMLLTGDPWFVNNPQRNMAKHFEENGYETYFVGKTSNAAQDQWEQFQHQKRLGHARDQEFPGRSLVDTAIEYLDHNANEAEGRPFLMYLAGPAPHDPYLGPEEFFEKYRTREIPMPPDYLPEHPFDNGEMNVRYEHHFPPPRSEETIRQVLQEYYAVIDQLDTELARLLAELVSRGLWENTIIVFTSDQGISLGSHGLIAKQSLYESTMGVPFIIVGPGIEPGQTDALGYLFDVFPTIAELAGIPVPEGIHGRSLAPVIGNPSSDHREDILLAYTKADGTHVQRAVRRDNWKYFYYPHNGIEQLFNLADDPHEMNNLSEDPDLQDKKREMQQIMRQMQEDLEDPYHLPAEPGGTAVIVGGEADE